jgi:tetratricopeptide (TPR) repeat protein
VHGYVLDPSTKDVFIVGTPAISREARLDIDLFTVLMETVWAKGLIPRVSIDPMPADSSGSDDSPRRSNIQRGRDGTAIDWLAPMPTRAINLPSDALVSRIMLDADYEMKRINYGLVKVDFKTYVDVLTDEKNRSRPAGRWWFHPIPLNSNTVRVSASGRVLLFDAGLQLLTESMTIENAALAGTGEADILRERAVEEFTRGYQHLESSPTVKPAGVFALLRGITDIVTMCKVLRDSEVDYSVLEEFRRLPYHHLSGAEAVPTSYPALTTKFVRKDGTRGAIIGGGVTLLSRPTRRSLDRFDDDVGVTFERAAADFQGDGFMRRVALTFTLATQQVGGSPAAELAKVAGRRLLQRNEPAAASQRFREATAKDPVDIDAWIYLAHAEAQAGNQVQARSAIEQARAIDPNDSMARKVAAQIAFLAKKAVLANPAAFEFETVDPVIRRELSDDYAEGAFRYAGRGRFYEPDYQTAIKNADLALRWWPDNAQAYIARGLSRWFRDQSDAAMQDYDQAIRLDPTAALAYVYRGQVFRHKSDYNRAIQDYDQAIRLDPNNARAFVERGDAYRRHDRAKRDYKRAIADYSEALRINPAYLGAFESRADLFDDIRDYDRAIEDYSQLIRLDAPKKHYLHFYSRGRAYHYKGDVDLAIADYSQSLRLEPGWELVIEQRAEAYLKKRDLDGAIADYTELIRLKPNDSSYYKKRAIIWKYNGDLDRAIADYTEAIRLDPNNSARYKDRAIIWKDKGDLDRVIADYTEVIRVDPKSSAAYYDRASVLEGKGEFDRAIADYSEAIRLRPRHTDAFKNRAGVYRAKGEYDLAIADYSQVIELYPKDAETYAPRGRTNFLKGDFTAAAADLDIYTTRYPDAHPALWLHLARQRTGQHGTAELEAQAARLTKLWPYPVIDFYLGRSSPDEMLSAAARPDHLCQAQFYLGEWHLLRRNSSDAKSALQTAADICPKSSDAYQGAVAELTRLKR